VAEGIAEGLGDVGGVAVVLLHRAHDLRLHHGSWAPHLVSFAPALT
jgi:hypothetical protein